MYNELSQCYCINQKVESISIQRVIKTGLPFRENRDPETLVKVLTSALECGMNASALDRSLEIFLATQNNAIKTKATLLHHLKIQNELIACWVILHAFLSC